MRFLSIRMLGSLGATVLFVACSSSSSDAPTDPTNGPSTDPTQQNPANPNKPGTDPTNPTGNDSGPPAPPACGANSGTLCNTGEACGNAADCKSANCREGKCQDVTPADGVKNGDETDVDCGGSKAPACADGKGCATKDDCTSQVCTGNVCQAPTHTDGVKNGDETGLDCGGPTANKCPTGEGCATNDDCDAAKCDTGATMKCLAPSHSDGVKNLDETGIDCGGPTAPNRCATGQGCTQTSDCNNVKCDGATCLPASHDDGIKNLGETDIDCGGNQGAAKCAVGLTCGADSDCTVACNYASRCVEARSCKTQHGGDTCGPTGTDSCCVSLSNGAGATIDKYNITAGRFRQMVQDTNGDIRGWINGHKPAWWNDGWTQYLPTKLDNGGNQPDFTGLYQEVGPDVHGTAEGSNEGCSIKGKGARTYRLPDAINTRMGDPQYYSQDFLDDRSLNCVPAYLIQAFCAWDGGKVPTSTEWNAAWGGGKYPWGNTGDPAGFAYAYDTNIFPGGTLSYAPYGNGNASQMHAAPYTPYQADLKWANFDYNYWGGATKIATDYSIYVAPPGRFPAGNSPSGHADMAGNVFNSLQLTARNNAGGGTTFSQYWTKSGSWQGHPIPYGAFTGDAQNKYWAKGGRCSR